MNGLDALTVFGQRHPELPVVILSGSVNPGIMQRVLAQGAAGFITKSGKSAELLSAIRQVLSGEIYVSREFASMLSKDPAASGQSPPVFTARQEEVLRLLQNGLSNREIGTQLSLSDETVKSHVASILRALGVSTRLQAVRQAARWGYDKASWPAR
ncbi:transcriptional regulatory protein DegU [mine drainage metagenome]|uniref:Transcriptional regulatory protein DegU n=1 Tax=mine drainage metagenome TaxID=410659 RepID=A0A1J5P950_9ZZZZ